MLSSYVMVLTFRLIFVVCLVFLIVFKIGLCLVLSLEFRHVFHVMVFHVNPSCKEIGLRVCLKGRLLTFLEHGRA